MWESTFKNILKQISCLIQLHGFQKGYFFESESYRGQLNVFRRLRAIISTWGEQEED